MLAHARGGPARVTVLLWPYLPASSRAAARGARRRRSPRCARRGARRRRRERSRSARPEGLEALFPKDGGAAAAAVIDSPHASRPLRAARRRARRGRPWRRASRGCSPSASTAPPAAPRSPPPRPSRRCTPRRAPPELRRAASTSATWLSCARSPPTSAAWRSARRAWTSTARARPRADQQRAFAAQIALARETDKPLVIHSRAAEQETLAQLAARSRRRDRRACTASRCPTGSRSASQRGYLRSRSPATSPTRAPQTLAAAAARRRPRSGCWWRPTPPI